MKKIVFSVALMLAVVSAMAQTKTVGKDTTKTKVKSTKTITHRKPTTRKVKSASVQAIPKK